jgi:hypothetical protein
LVYKKKGYLKGRGRKGEREGRERGLDNMTGCIILYWLKTQGRGKNEDGRLGSSPKRALQRNPRFKSP